MNDETVRGPLEHPVGRRLFLVRHPQWHGASIAIFDGYPRAWGSANDCGRVSASVADAMVNAGIAEWADYCR